MLRPTSLTSLIFSYITGSYPFILRKIARTGPAIPAPAMITFVLLAMGCGYESYNASATEPSSIAGFICGQERLPSEMARFGRAHHRVRSQVHIQVKMSEHTRHAEA